MADKDAEPNAAGALQERAGRKRCREPSEGAADHWPTSQTAGTSVPPALGGATACTGPNGSFQAGSGQDDHKMKNPDPAGFGPINEGDRETSNGKPLNTKTLGAGASFDERAAALQRKLANVAAALACGQKRLNEIEAECRNILKVRPATLVPAVSNTAAQVVLAPDAQQDKDTAQDGATVDPPQAAPHSSGRSDANAGTGERQEGSLEVITPEQAQQAQPEGAPANLDAAVRVLPTGFEAAPAAAMPSGSAPAAVPSGSAPEPAVASPTASAVIAMPVAVPSGSAPAHAAEMPDSAGTNGDADAAANRYAHLARVYRMQAKLDASHAPNPVQAPNLPPDCTLPQLLQLSSTRWNTEAAMPTLSLQQQTFECLGEVEPTPGCVLVQQAPAAAAAAAAAVGEDPDDGSGMCLCLSLEVGDVQQLLWQGPRCVLQGGVLRVPADTQVVISGSGTDLTLGDMDISGDQSSVLRITGPGCSVVLERVNLQSCSVVVEGGACATLRECTSDRCLVGVLATGAQSRARLESCSVASCDHALCADDQATIMATKLQAALSARVAVDVRTRAHIALHEGCTLSDSGATALMVRSAGTATLQGCSVTGSRKDAIEITGAGSELEASECTLRENRETGVWVRARAKATLRGCDGSYNGRQGAEVDGADSCLDARECVLSNNGGSGVWADEGGKATLTKCTLNSNKGQGVHVTQKDSMVLASDCAMKLNGASGVWVQEGAKGMLDKCSLNGNTTEGAGGHSAGSRLSVSCSTMRNNKRHGLWLMEGAVADVQACHLIRNTWHGVKVEGDGSKMTAVDSDLRDNGQNGVTVVESARAMLTDCSVTGNEWRGTWAAPDSELVTENCTISGNAHNGPAL